MPEEVTATSVLISAARSASTALQMRFNEVIAVAAVPLLLAGFDPMFAVCIALQVH
jgi:hypothetical protein